MTTPSNPEDRYLTGTIEPATKVADRLHAALEHLRSCEVEGVAGADDEVVLDALFSYEAFQRSRDRKLSLTEAARELGMERKAVVTACVRTGVPILAGRINMRDLHEALAKEGGR